MPDKGWRCINGPMRKTETENMEDLGKLVLRVSLGILILLHGIAKIIGGVGNVSGLLSKAGMPTALAYLVFIGEVLAPALLVAGVWSRAAALVIAFNMIVAVYLAHGQQIFSLSRTGGWALELQGIYFAAAITLALLGAGRYSLGGKSGRWN
jgi:putative oxidoreductase